MADDGSWCWVEGLAEDDGIRRESLGVSVDEAGRRPKLLPAPVLKGFLSSAAATEALLASSRSVVGRPRFV